MIVKNSSFLFWHDPWLANSPLSSRYEAGIISVANSLSLERVGEFTTEYCWQLPLKPHVDDWIKASCQPSSYILTWFHHLERSACFYCLSLSLSLIIWSSVWDSIRHHKTPPPWIHAIWHPLHTPKCAFLLWLALQNRLLTKDHIMNFGIPGDPSCQLCNMGMNESIQHLFTTCYVQK